MDSEFLLWFGFPVVLFAFNYFFIILYCRRVRCCSQRDSRFTCIRCVFKITRGIFSILTRSIKKQISDFLSISSIIIVALTVIQVKTGESFLFSILLLLIMFLGGTVISFNDIKEFVQLAGYWIIVFIFLRGAMISYILISVLLSQLNLYNLMDLKTLSIVLLYIDFSLYLAILSYFRKYDHRSLYCFI